MKPELIICGGAGQMGKRIISLALEADEFNIVAAIERKNHPDLGKDLGQLAGSPNTGTKLSDSWPDSADVVIDFSQPEGIDAAIDFCLAKKAALVLGTTGLSTDQHKKITQAAKTIPVIYGTNMSVGMNVLFSLVGKAASMLGDNYDIEITEQHHRFKKDAPSGSALTLAENIAKATDRKFPDCLTYGRNGKDALRKKGNIGIHAIRAGDIAGIHSVIFSTLGETVTLNHRAHSKDGFARGALQAAKWLSGKKPGSYSMPDVLGLE